MNSDYVAWNGERYVWPPPEGWYLASDGRWWAPDTGPDVDLHSVAGDPAPVAGASAPVADPGLEHRIDAVDHHTDHVGQAGGVEPAPDADHRVPQATHDPDPVPGPSLFPDPEVAPDFESAQARTPEFDSTVAYRPDSTEPRASEPATQPAVSRPPSGQIAAVAQTDTDATMAMAMAAEPARSATGPNPVLAADPDTGRHDQVPILEPTAPASPKTQRSRTMPMVAAGLLVAAAIVIAALLSLLGGDDDTQAPQPSASAEDADESSDELVVSTDDSSTATSADGTVDDGTMDDGTMDDGTMDDGTMDDGTMDDEGQEATSTTAAESTAGGDNAALIGQFRTLLEDNQITAAALTGDDLVVFGQTACNYASSATDLPEYEQVRNDALDGAQNDELSIGELQFVVDAAVTVFCTEDATRLGLTPTAPSDG